MCVRAHTRACHLTVSDESEHFLSSLKMSVLLESCFIPSLFLLQVSHRGRDSFDWDFSAQGLRSQQSLWRGFTSGRDGFMFLLGPPCAEPENSTVSLELPVNGEGIHFRVKWVCSETAIEIKIQRR